MIFSEIEKIFWLSYQSFINTKRNSKVKKTKDNSKYLGVYFKKN